MFRKKLLSLGIVLLFLIGLGGSALASYGVVVTRDATPEALAILAEDSKNTLVSAIFEGVEEQILIATASRQGFPIEGNSYVILSSGNASRAIIGGASTDIDSNVRGVSIPNGHPVFGTDIYDVATLEIKLKVPRDAKTLSFKWIFGSDEIPEYVDEYRDFFRAYVKLPDGSTKDIALLPNGNIPYIGDGIRNYTSTPSPDDVSMNEVTPVYTGTLDVSAYRGKEITIVFQIADDSDSDVDTVAFIDDLKFERISTREIYLTLLTLTQLWTKYFFNYYDEFDELYANASALGVDNETLQKALELHNSAVEYMKHGWRMDDLEEIRARIWVNIHALPRVSDVRRAYLNEKAAVELLKAAISEIT